VCHFIFWKYTRHYQSGGDVMKIFRRKNLKFFLTQNTYLLLFYMQQVDNNFGFQESSLFRRKLAQIAENCDLNIDPR
jgi:hypothetical protein